MKTVKMSRLNISSPMVCPCGHYYLTMPMHALVFDQLHLGLSVHACVRACTRVCVHVCVCVVYIPLFHCIYIMIIIHYVKHNYNYDNSWML